MLSGVLFFTDGVDVFVIVAEACQTLTWQRQQLDTSILAADAPPAWAGWVLLRAEHMLVSFKLFPSFSPLITEQVDDLYDVEEHRNA